MENNTVTYTAPSRVLVIVWALFLAIMLVYGHDAKQWAEASPSTVAQQVVLPASAPLDSLSESIGLNSLRDSMANATHQFYNDAYRVGAIESAEGSEDALAQRYFVAAAPAVSSQISTSIPGIFSVEQIRFQGASVDSANGMIWQAGATPKKVLIVGASSIQEGLGTEIERKFKTYKDVEVMRFGQFNSGLCDPSYFNWDDKMKELKTSFKPDLIIAFWGENDCRGINDLNGKNLSHFGTDEWEKIYGDRVGGLVKAMSAGGTKVVMLGVPVMRSKKFSNQVSQLNAVTKKATEANGGVFLALWPFTVDKDGNYVASVTHNGKERLIRAGDGIHFTTHGSEFLADKIGEEMVKKYSFKSK